jgi:hypothetical protein
MGHLASVKSDQHHEDNKTRALHDPQFVSSTVYGSQFAAVEIPKWEMPEGVRTSYVSPLDLESRASPKNMLPRREDADP